MSLQFILGGSGSGKTTYLYDRIIRSSVENPRQQYFVIVPEQFTMQAQKDIVTMHPDHATMNIDIVSFERLAYRIFEELAVENLKVLDDMGKSMVLRKVAAQKRRELVLFRGHLGQTGFVNQLKSMLSEFYQYGIGPEQLREMAALAGTPLFKQKLEDFALVYEGFREYIAGHYITTEEVLDVLCRVLPGSELIKNSIIALDGYTGFTPVQYRLAELFMVYAKQVAVTVTAEDGESVYRSMGMQNLFFMSRQMERRLSELAEKNGIKKAQDVVLPEKESPRFLKGGQLACLERRLFRYGQGQYHGEDTGELELFSAQSPSEEISHVICRMRRLMREQKLRWRDMAVITGDLPGYGKEIAHQFELNGIPYFMDDKKNLLENPMAELIRAALEVVQRDFSYESVFRFLRCGLVTEEREMTDRLENYVIALGIRGGKRWRQVWERTYRGGGSLNLTELNEYRDRVLAPVFALQDSFRREDITIGGMVQAVRELLADCGVQEKLDAWQRYFSGQKEYRLAREYSQVYELADDLLTRLSDLLGGEKAGRREFMEILDAGFGELKVGAIPATVDRVVVGDITRTRLAGVKALFFVGVNDGIVPSRRERGSLLSDRERELFAEHSLELAPTAREDSFQQRFYLYLMMTKPSQKLILSFAAVGGDGKSRRPSFLIGELKKLFPALQVQEAGAEEDVQVYSPEDARRRLAAGLGQLRDGEQTGSREQFLELYRWFLSDRERRAEAFRLVEAAFRVYENQGIGHAAARALYGSVLSGSVTRLEQYAACAYGHFLKYGLELMERQRYQLQAADMGNLFHDSIDLCFSRVKEQGLDWKIISDEDRDCLVHSCVEQVTEEYGNQILGSSARNAYLARRVEQITKRTVWALQQQIIRGDFVPAGFEVSFSAADNLRAMKISLSEDEALHLRGRIDRMDLCRDGGQVYVKIIDYKSGGTSFDLLALYYGLQLQLVVYMDAVMEMAGRHYPGKEIVPAGILYYNIGDPLVEKGEAADQEAIDREILKKLRMNGLVNSELEVIRHMDSAIEKKSDIIPVVLKDGSVQEEKSSVANRQRFADLSRFVQDKLKTAGREILNGQIGVEPYKNGQRTACDYCPYHSVCGFDKKTSGYEYRRWSSKKTEEIWEEICQNQQSTGQKSSGR
ncbi:MAG: helicase-exonuclease AddAB subunit AddB [Eubacteriales bacterium]|nr:helicase-exonuclease AddAB subunit AddB [Eubacteriales bacterium]